MNDEEKKAWEELVRYSNREGRTQLYAGDAEAIKSADAELTALRSRLSLAEAVANEVPFLLSVIASGETLSDEEMYYQRELLRRARDAGKEGGECHTPAIK